MSQRQNFDFSKFFSPQTLSQAFFAAAGATPLLGGHGLSEPLLFPLSKSSPATAALFPFGLGPSPQTVDEQSKVGQRMKLPDISKSRSSPISVGQAVINSRRNEQDGRTNLMMPCAGSTFY
jgi:hypothetical protein